MRIDLHTHSVVSDGTDTPAQLMQAAHDADLNVIALTDHDSTQGWDAAIAALPGTGLTFVGGIELSCAVVDDIDGRRTSIHVLGYLVNPENPELIQLCEQLQQRRIDRARRSVQLLNDAGYDIDWEMLMAMAGNTSVGRPHIARALMQIGAVRSVNEAMATLLHESSPFYTSKQDADVVTGLSVIRNAGGVPVMAHPLARLRGRVVNDEVIAEMAAAGLVGIEINHTDHTETDREHLTGLAKELGLIVTGSSDYHGKNKSIPLGIELTAPDAYDALVSRATGFQPVTT